MKINNIIIMSMLIMLMVFTSCKKEEETGYDAEKYQYQLSEKIELNKDLSKNTDSSFVFTYKAPQDGVGYYVVKKKGEAQPSPEEIYSATSGKDNLLADHFKVTKSEVVLDTVVNSELIFGGHEYSVYAVHQSPDGFISDKVTSLSVSTPNTIKPQLLTTIPEKGAEGIEYKDQQVTFIFNKPVKLNDGAVFKVDIYNAITKKNLASYDISPKKDSLSGQVYGDYATEITIGGWDGIPDVFTVISYKPGTFLDKDGGTDVGIAPGEYFFESRNYNQEEAVEMLLGKWSYQLECGNFFKPEVASVNQGTWEVKKGEKEGTIILYNQLDHDLAAFFGEQDDSAYQEFVVTVKAPGTKDGQYAGYLILEPTMSQIDNHLGEGTKPYWTGHLQDEYQPFIKNLAGIYDLGNNEIYFMLNFASEGGSSNTDYYFGNVLYLYSR